MTTFALIHGAGNAFDWSRLAPILRQAGHRVVAPDLPMADPEADFHTFADVLDAQLPDSSDLVVVGLSMGAFTAPVLAARHPGARMVLVAPMIPIPDETPGEWFTGVGVRQAQREAAEQGGYDPAFDLHRTFFHDVPPEVVADIMSGPEPVVADELFGRHCPITAWPDAPTRVIAGSKDRMFPFELISRLARERLGVQAEPMDTGHCVPLVRPQELAERLVS